MEFVKSVPNDKEQILAAIKSQINTHREVDLKKMLEELHPADIAEIIESLAEKQRVSVFGLLSSEKAAAVLYELNSEIVAPLMESLDKSIAAEIMDEMSTDDAADIIGDLKDEDKAKLLNLMEYADAEDVQELMDYPEDTAGGIMTTEYVAIREDITVERAIQVVREFAQEAETVYYVYVINERNQLVGVISLRELILAKSSATIADVMRRKVVSVNVQTDQEEVANMVAKYDFLAVPVVDNNNQLLGIVTVDDVIDVIREEATEDMYLLVGTTEIDDEEDLYHRIRKSVRYRLPWLLITLMSGVISGQIIKSFSGALNAMVALAFFIPLLTGMGGNLGTQSSTIIVRGIATGQIDSRKILHNIIREGLVGLSIGLICGFIVAIFAVLWQGKPILGLIVGLAMWGNMVTAATIGTLVPLLLKKLNVDPAVASAPFISTTLDNTGLIIYGSLTMLFFKFLI
ncbi:magnesium transporter [Thermincola potens]|uniref:Magnesium transporter MgtE n=1 Tax=Thermincola potens (strain JR) TaxID=635013 RepID=D5XAQ2_THEPJ|nr:magnesium transporter [Thermincola potens]ADG83256.1 magnesium transporter [Thermincola potens JR]